MERMRHHVTASGNTTLRGFYASENVNFDPPNPSMRINVQKAKCNFVVGLANGATSRAEEERIRDAVGRSQNSYEVIRMVSALGGWDGMDDELEPGDLDEIAKNILPRSSIKGIIPSIGLSAVIFRCFTTMMISRDQA